jgi:hypothetical protein
MQLFLALSDKSIFHQLQMNHINLFFNPLFVERFYDNVERQNVAH